MKKLFLFFIATLFVACGGHGNRIWENSYILWYAPAHPQLKEHYAINSSGNPVGVPEYSIEVWGGGSDAPIPSFAKSCSYDNNKSMYKQLCQKHHDNSYKEERYEWPNTPGVNDAYIAVSADFVDIDITCSPAYDDAHPDGSSVADIVKVTFTTLKPFIDAGYKYTQNNSEWNCGLACYTHPNYYHYVKMMNEMTARDMILLGPTMNLEFVTPPATQRIYTLVLTMVTDEGDVYTNRMTVQMPIER